MRGERAKTIILILLVGLSMVQTGLLWYGFRPRPALTPILAPTRPPGPAPAVPGKETIDLITPIQAFVSLGEGNYALLRPASPTFQKAWEKVATGLREEQIWLQQKWEPLAQAPDLGLPGTCQWDFPLTLSLDQWRDLLFPGPVPTAGLPDMAGLVLAPGGQAYVRDGEGNYYPWSLDLELGLVEEGGGAPAGPEGPPPATDGGPALPLATGFLLYQQPPADEYSWAPGVYLPGQEVYLPVFKAAVEKLPLDLVTGTFFADMSLVRNIQERDGAAIYTDGQRALRLYPTGTLEYSYPSLRGKGPLLPFEAAYERSRHFVEQHGGWPAEIRLGEVKNQRRFDGEYYHLGYRQYEKGIPILLPAPVLNLSVHSGGVADYGRQVITYYQIEAAQPLVSPLELLAAVPSPPDLPAEEGEGEGEGEGERPTITALSLAYYGQPQGKKEYILQPAWVLTTAGNEYYFDGYTGSPLNPPGAGEGGQSRGLEPR